MFRENKLMCVIHFVRALVYICREKRGLNVYLASAFSTHDPEPPKPILSEQGAKGPLRLWCSLRLFILA